MIEGIAHAASTAECFLLTGRLYWLLCGAYFDEFNAGRGSRNRKAIFAEAFDVEFDSFLDKFQDLVASFRDCDATW